MHLMAAWVGKFDMVLRLFSKILFNDQHFLCLKYRKGKKMTEKLHRRVSHEGARQVCVESRPPGSLTFSTSNSLLNSLCLLHSLKPEGHTHTHKKKKFKAFKESQEICTVDLNFNLN